MERGGRRRGRMKSSGRGGWAGSITVLAGRTLSPLLGQVPRYLDSEGQGLLPNSHIGQLCLTWAIRG